MSVDSGYPGARDAQIFEHRRRVGVEAEEEQVLPREGGVFLHQEDEVFLDRDELLAHNLPSPVIWTASSEGIVKIDSANDRKKGYIVQNDQPKYMFCRKQYTACSCTCNRYF